MSNWKRLDLFKASERPRPEQLVALRMAPTNSNSPYYHRAKYDIGEFRTDPSTGRNRREKDKRKPVTPSPIMQGDIDFAIAHC